MEVGTHRTYAMGIAKFLNVGQVIVNMSRIIFEGQEVKNLHKNNSTLRGPLQFRIATFSYIWETHTISNGIYYSRIK